MLILSHNLLVEKNLALAMIMIGTDLKPDYHTYLGGFFILFFFEMGLHYISQTGLDPEAILLPHSITRITGMHMTSSAFSLCIWGNLLLVSIYQPFHLYFSSASGVLELQVCTKHWVPFSLYRWDSLLFLFLSHYVFCLMVWSPETPHAKA